MHESVEPVTSHAQPCGCELVAQATVRAPDASTSQRPALHHGLEDQGANRSAACGLSNDL